MKIASIIEAMKLAQARGSDLRYRLVHTGQHYDRAMSSSFFEQLGIPEPDVNLEAGSGTQAEQTGAIMVRYEKLLREAPSELCVVVGDVTSTMACSIVARKQGVRVAHIEAGIRSRDWSMPEEINRVVTDSVANWFFTTSETANRNLREAGVTEDRIFMVGNTMIDTLLRQMTRLRPAPLFAEAGLQPGEYFVLTLHRPANVDDPEKLSALLSAIIDGTRGVPIVFPVHPRTRKVLSSVFRLPSSVLPASCSPPSPKATAWQAPLPARISLLEAPSSELPAPRSMLLVDPLGYLEFNHLAKNAKAVITDSGGITEETTVMGIPCLSLRANTERPETVTIGTNELIGTDPGNLKPALDCLFAGQWKKGGIPDKWDGKAGERIVEILERLV